MSQKERFNSIQNFRAHKATIMVATDVVARGLDVPEVELVLNYDVPFDSDLYVHRIGRTARAGKDGLAVSLVTEFDRELLLSIEKRVGRQIEEVALNTGKILKNLNLVTEALKVAKIVRK